MPEKYVPQRVTESIGKVLVYSALGRIGQVQPDLVPALIVFMRPCTLAKTCAFDARSPLQD